MVLLSNSAATAGFTGSYNLPVAAISGISSYAEKNFITERLTTL